MTFSNSIHRTFPHRDWELRSSALFDCWWLVFSIQVPTWESNSSEPHLTVQQVYFVTEVIRLNKKCQVKKTVKVWSFSLVIVSLCVCVCVWLPSMSNCNSMFHTFSASATSFVSQETAHTSRWECTSFFQNLWSFLISLSSVSFCQIKSHGTQELLEGRGILSSINDNIDSSHAQFFWYTNADVLLLQCSNLWHDLRLKYLL